MGEAARAAMARAGARAVQGCGARTLTHQWRTRCSSCQASTKELSWEKSQLVPFRRKELPGRRTVPRGGGGQVLHHVPMVGLLSFPLLQSAPPSPSCCAGEGKQAREQEWWIGPSLADGVGRLRFANLTREGPTTFPASLPALWACPGCGGGGGGSARSSHHSLLACLSMLWAAWQAQSSLTVPPRE